MHGTPPRVLARRIERDVVAVERQRRGAADDDIWRVKLCASDVLERRAPGRHVGRHAHEREQDRRRRQQRPRVDAAAAVETARGIGIVEVVDDPRDLHALVVVQLVLEHAVRQRVGVEHQVAADEAARVGEAVRKASRLAEFSSRRGVSAPLAASTTAFARWTLLALRRGRSTSTSLTRPAASVSMRNTAHSGRISQRPLASASGIMRGERRRLGADFAAEEPCNSRS